MNEEENNNYSGGISPEIVNINPPITPDNSMVNNNFTNQNANIGINNGNNMYGSNVNTFNSNFNNVNTFDAMSNMNGSIPKKGKKWLIPVIIGIIIVILLVGGVSYKMIMSSPKVIFENSINSLYKGLNNTLEEVDQFEDSYDFLNRAVVFKGDIKLDTNIEEVKELGINLGDYTLGGEFGVDFNNELLQGNVYLKGKSEKIDLQMYMQDDYIYGTSNLLDGMIQEEFSDMSEIFEEIKKAFEELKEEDEIEVEDYDYILQVIKDALIESLNSDQMKKENDTIKVSGKDIKVTKYIYEMNDKDVQEMYEFIIDEILNDKECVEKLAKISGESESDIEDYLKEMKDSSKDIEFDEKISFNIYTSGLLNNTTGISLEYDGKEYFHCYVDGDNFDVYINYEDVYEDDEKIISITGEIKKDEIEIKVNVDEEEVAILTVREFSRNLIDLEYELVKEKSISSIYVSVNEEKDSINGTYKVREENDGEYISIEGTYGFDFKDKLEKVNPTNIITEETIDKEAIEKKIEDIINKDEAFKNLYDLISGFFQSLITNEYGMMNITTIDEIKSAIGKDKAVLYVGSSNNAYKSSAELEVINNLVNIQNYYGFTSYYYDYSVIPQEFEQLIQGVTVDCASKNGSDLPMNCEPGTNCLVTCPVTPAIYFIKEGKIVSGIRGEASIAELSKAVENIGYTLKVVFDNEKEDI